MVTAPLSPTIDADGFTPRLLALLSNALVWRESTELRKRFGLGTNDWRILSALALRPGMTATDISEFLPVNKALISKSVNTLADRGLLVLFDGPRGSRPIFLTREGAETHDQMLPISMRGQEIILEGMTQTEIEQFNELLRRMLAQLRDSTSATSEDPDAPVDLA